MLPVVILLVILAAALVWLHRHRHQRDRVWWSAWLVPALSLGVIAILVVTDLYLQKIVGRLLMPAGLVWALLILATFLLALRRSFGLSLICFGITVLYTLAGNVWLGTALVRSLEVMVRPVDPATVEPFEVVAVLGGGTDVDPHGRPQLGNYGGRLAMGVRLFYAGKAPLLVASGIGLDGRQLSDETRQIWTGLGIPDTSIVMLPKARTTKEEIHELKLLAEERGWQRIGLVSSAWHLPRALVHCGDEGFAVTPIPCDWRSGAEPWWFLNLIPHKNGFEKVEIGCWEWVGRWVR